MNVSKNSMNVFSVFSQRFGQSSMMKSTREKLQRQEKAQNQIAYWENQKENLKEMECDTLEEIAQKLEMYHSYEDEITAAKQAYNFEQMHHVLDEAQEQGEKIAEAAKKTEPKTEEERKKEAAKEAAGTEETGGMLSDLLDEMTESIEELTEELAPEAMEELAPEAMEEPAPEAMEEPAPEAMEEPAPETVGEPGTEAMEELVQMEGTEETASDTAKDLPERQAQKLAKEHQRNQELTEKYADMAGSRAAKAGGRFDYRM